MAEALRRGYKVALPVGEDWRYDLIVLRQNKLERVQCKYTESNGQYVEVRCRSTNNWNVLKYTKEDVDWVVAYDKTTDRCYFIPSSMLGTGRSTIWLRLLPPKNGQKKDILWAKDFTDW